MRTIGIALAAALMSGVASAEILIAEPFDDTSFTARGWYGTTGVALSTTDRYSGDASLKLRFLAGSKTPVSLASAIRHKFPQTDSLYLRYYVKYSSNWVGSQVNYHPHQFYFLTNKAADYSGLSTTNLTAYVEDNGGKLQFSMQDALNIDTNNINVNLSNVSENRAVAGCNGNLGSGTGNCYNQSGWRNEKVFRSPAVNFTNTPGPNYKGDWHKVEVYLKMNSIVDGKGVADGIVRYWLDDAIVMDYDDILMRTGANATMLFNQFAIAPYIGVGSPVDQTMWIDDLVLATERTTVEASSPRPPVLLDLL